MYIAYEAKLAIPLSILYFKAKFLTDFFAHLQTYNPINNNITAYINLGPLLTAALMSFLLFFQLTELMLTLAYFNLPK